MFRHWWIFWKESSLALVPCPSSGGSIPRRFGHSMRRQSYVSGWKMIFALLAWSANSICFCPLHLKRFGKSSAGSHAGRGGFGILQQGTPLHAKAYLDMRRHHDRYRQDTGKDRPCEIPRYLHRIDVQRRAQPHARGRRWQEFAHSVADGKQLFSRPPTAIYQEFSIRDNYYAGDSFLLTRGLMPQDAIEQRKLTLEFYPLCQSVTSRP